MIKKITGIVDVGLSRNTLSVCYILLGAMACGFLCYLQTIAGNTVLRRIVKGSAIAPGCRKLLSLFDDIVYALITRRYYGGVTVQNSGERNDDVISRVGDGSVLS